MGERLDPATPIGQIILSWQGDPGPLADNLPLRVCGSLHALVLSGQAAELAAVYPPNAQPDDARLWGAISATFGDHGPGLLSRLDKAPQTNEVGRSGPLMAGLMTLVRETGLPVALFELGASAGLNLNLDRFAYDLGGVQSGDQSSAVRLAPRWEGPPPPAVKVEVVSRQGVDLSPLYVDRAEDRELLSAYVWPDQTERLARVKAAIAIAQAHPYHLDQADAADWAERVLAPVGPEGVTRVLYHTIAFQYFPAASQARIRAHIARIGESATPNAPFAWLRYELEPEQAAVALRLSLWPSAQERLLGLGHPHGQAFQLLQ